MSMTACRATRNHLVMVAILLTITSTVPTPCVSSKASPDQWAAGVAMHQSRRPYTLMRPEIVAPNQHRTANRNKDAATTTTTTGSSSFQHVGKKEDLLDLQQQLAHERRQNHPHVMLLARKALTRPTPRGIIAAGRLQVVAASSSLAADCDDAVAVETPAGSYSSWRAQWLRAGHTFKLHPMQLFFLCTTTTNINKAAAKKTTQNSDGVIPVARSRRALKQLIPPAPPLTIPPLPFTIIPPLPFSINPSPPGLTIPPFLPPPITFPPFPVTFPPLSSFTPPPAAQKASVAMP